MLLSFIKTKFVCFVSVVISLLISFNTLAQQETPIFFKKEIIDNIQKNLLNNIATESGEFKKALYPKDCKKKEAILGAVVAAPYNALNPGKDSAKSSYMYTWVRDSSTAMSVVLNLFKNAIESKNEALINKYGQMMLNYIAFQQELIKHKDFTPGIARSFLNGVPDLQWMNPQNDGPGSNSELLAEFAYILITQNPKINDRAYGSDYVTKELYNKKGDGIININLNYIVKNYKKAGYDLWESCVSEHFYTKMVQLKGLIYGSALAVFLKDNKNAKKYMNIATKLVPLILKHWQSYNYKDKIHECYCEGLGITKDLVFPMSPAASSKNFSKYRGMGVDSSILLGALYGNLYTITQKDSWVHEKLKSDSILFTKLQRIIAEAEVEFFVTSPKVQITVNLLTEAFVKGGLDPYPINDNTERGIVYLGRYPGDLYNGDTWNNPKNKANAWFLCTTALAHYYYTLAYELKRPEYIEKGNKVMELVYKYIGNKKTISENKSPYYTMSEQLNRKTGAEESFRNLSWSYAEYMFAYQAYLKAISIH